MMPAAKHFDPVLGIDIHIVQPPGPVPPVPIPHPFVGFLIDPFDYVPIIGATVMVNGLPRAQAGTMGKAVPVHIPIGGMFVKPPANECEMFMGSATVEVDGDAFSFLSLPALSCQDIGMPPPPRINPKKKSKVKSLVLPTSVVLPIPAGPPVQVGGPPTISLMAMGMKVGMGALGKGFKRLAKSSLVRRLGGAFKKARQKVFGKMKPGFLKCKVLRAEPVDVITGEVVVEQQDFVLPGRIPLEWTRRYSSQAIRMGYCGYGWETPADARLVFEADGAVSFYDGSPGSTLFPSLPETGPVEEFVDGAVLDHTGNTLTVRVKSGLTYHFAIPQGGEEEVLLERLSDLCGNSWRFLRHHGALREMTDNSGRRIEVVSQDGRIQRMLLHHPDEVQPHLLVRYAYNALGDLTDVFDPLDMPYRFFYHNHCLTQHTDRNGLSFYYEYDQHTTPGRCIHSFGDNGLYDYHFEYSEVLGETKITDSLGHVTVIQYDKRLLPIKEIDPLGGETEFEYDEVGRTSAVIDPAGHRTEYAYDERGNLVQLTRPDGATVTTIYDHNNCPILITDPTGNIWRYVWDDKRLLRQRISPRGGAWLYEYNGLGDLSIATDPLGAKTYYQRDAFGNLATVRDALGYSTRLEADLIGNIISSFNALGNKSSYVYDLKGRLIEVNYPSGHFCRFQYDFEDHVIALDQNGYRTQLRYSGLGEVVERIKPDGSRIQYQYDTEEKLSAVINECGQRYELVRDAMGRIVREIDYWGNTRLYRYDVAGRISETIDALGRQTVLRYDMLGRLVERIFFDGQKEQFGYDTNGNLTLAENGVIAVKREYDEDGNLVREEQGNFYIMNRYDLLGNRLDRVSSNGHTVEYAHNAMSDVMHITLDGDPLTTTQYDGLGRIVSETLAGRLQRYYAYDGDGRLIHQQLCQFGNPLVERQYRYDQGGNLLQLVDARKGTLTYRYDPVGRIREQIDTVGKIQHLLYDPAGNLAADLSTGLGDQGSRMSQVGGKTFYYDAAGHLVQKRSPSGDAIFTWDGNDRLISVINEQLQTVTFGYDALGRRVFKEVDGVRKTFCWDGDHLLSDTAGEDHPREFVFRPRTFEPLAYVNGRTCFYENDMAGVPHELIEAGGEVLWSASYGSLGEVSKLYERTVDNPIRLQGQYYDEETGLSYNRHRYYDPSLGCFISQDPLGLAGGHHVYAFAPNVWMWSDPYGLTCTTTFYSVQSAADAARLARGGEPWPTGLKRGNMGPGFYAWGSRADAENYLARLQQSDVTDLQIVSYRISDDKLSRLRTLDMRAMSDDAVNTWMERHSHYGDALPHDYQHVIRNTGMGAPEHYFSPDAFSLFGSG